MSAGKRTPGPWLVDEPAQGSLEIYAKRAGGNPATCDDEICIADVYVSGEEDHANAAFIVLACNAHDDLVAALKECSYFLKPRHGKVDLAPGSDASALCRMACAALAKAGVTP